MYACPNVNTRYKLVPLNIGTPILDPARPRLSEFYRRICAGIDASMNCLTKLNFMDPPEAQNTESRGYPILKRTCLSPVNISGKLTSTGAEKINGWSDPESRTPASMQEKTVCWLAMV